MLTHRGFSAWIVVNNQPLPEYLVALNAETNQVSCWIPSEEGQKFSVFWEDKNQGGVDTMAFVNLDGFMAPGRFLLNGQGRTFRSGVRTGQNTERPFVFRKVTESSIISPSPASPSSAVGMIVLKIKRVKRVANWANNQLQELSQGPQGSRQSGDMYVGFGENDTVSDRWDYTWGVQPLPEDGRPNDAIPTYVTFIFRYRTYEFLQAQGIAQGPPPPTSSAATRAPVRRILSAPVSGSSQQPRVLTTSSQMMRYAEQLSAGVPSVLDHPNRPSLEARRTASWVPTISVPIPARNAGYAGQHVLVPPNAPPENYYQAQSHQNQGYTYNAQNQQNQGYQASSQEEPDQYSQTHQSQGHHPQNNANYNYPSQSHQNPGP
ncbi:hypothetical protein V5O48_004107 [Marasmius crinis-equi]|uniref:Uncharacterized protein n=1 Tax=Marasmius crinis-equi TaxID=585013 RepID=A0ABR3FQZ1_9AGAR